MKRSRYMFTERDPKKAATAFLVRWYGLDWRSHRR